MNQILIQASSHDTASGTKYRKKKARSEAQIINAADHLTREYPSHKDHGNLLLFQNLHHQETSEPLFHSQTK
jgi:hypothetical protein